jgi:diguanylate cyclase (GGDEF)-like protein
VSDELARAFSRRLQRERAARKEAEALLEAKADELYQANEALHRSLVDLEETVAQRTRALARALVELRTLAYFDSLTGAANRRLYLERLPLALNEAGANQRIALLYIDVDDFKHVNDSYGHAAGDDVLRILANRLRDCVKGGDTVARLAGDEFGVLLSSLATGLDALEVASRLLHRLSEPIALADSAVEIVVRASIGVAVHPEDGSSVDALTSAADTAMYHAKQRGKDCIVRYNEDIGNEHRRLLELERALSAAVEQHQFELHYQPKVTLEDGTFLTSGFEALLRWRHPQRGLVPPRDFIHFAESRKLIIPIGEWVLRAACHQARRWLDCGYSFGAVSVNVAARQVGQASFIQTVDTALAEAGLPSHCLQLEVTESVLIDDTEKALTLFHALRERGVRVCIDDFGTRHASFGYLRDFTFDVLKIDQSFIRSLPDDIINVAIIESILPIATKLGMTAVAEGVETPAQLRLLLERGCRTFQGFLFARPMTPEQVEQRLASAQPWEPELDPGVLAALQPLMSG